MTLDETLVEANSSSSEKDFGGEYHGHNERDFGGDFTRADTVDTANTKEDDNQIRHVETFQTSYEMAVEGQMYQDGHLIIQPAPTRSPRDPMNLPTWHKVTGLGCVAFFGALIASAEIILGAALPVFALQYANLNPKILNQLTTSHFFKAGSNPLAILEHLGGPPIFDVYLLGSVPLLVIGVANLFLVPVAIAVGRRPVILATGLIAIAGACWAGSSQSLGSHIGARCLQAIGAASIESLIPFIIQDTIPVHQRNTWISAVFACQGIIIIAVGFSAPYIIINISWRWLYYITAICASFFWMGVFFFLPETRWGRTRSEINGIPRRDENVVYEPRSWSYDLAIFHGKQEWMKGVYAFVDVMRTFFYPQIFFVTILNSGFIGAGFAAGLTTCPALITEPWGWPFLHVGFCLVAVLIGAIGVAVVTGGLADHFANAVARKRGKRLPENQLINLVLPCILGTVGAAIYAVSGNDQENYHWGVFLAGVGFLAFGFLGCNSISTVYVLECYPHLAGPALVNVASFRWIIAFFYVFKVSDWILDLGYLRTFMIYTGLIGGLSLTIPIVYIYGPTWNKMFPAHSISHKNRSDGEDVADF